MWIISSDENLLVYNKYIWTSDRNCKIIRTFYSIYFVNTYKNKTLWYICIIVYINIYISDNASLYVNFVLHSPHNQNPFISSIDVLVAKLDLITG